MTERTDQQIADEALASAALVLALVRDDEAAVRVLLAGDDLPGIAACLAEGTAQLLEVLAQIDGEDGETAEHLAAEWQRRLLEIMGDNGSRTLTNGKVFAARVCGPQSGRPI